MKNAILKLFLWIFIILFTVNLLWSFFHHNGTFLFTSFLKFISSVEPMKIDFSFISAIADNNWGIFDFLRVFIKPFLNVLTGLGFIFNQIVNIIYYLMQFVRFLFF